MGVAALLVAVLVTAWVAGGETTGRSEGTDATRLGPEAGESVAGYLARVHAVPPGPPGPRLALVQFATPLDPAGAAAVLDGSGADLDQAVFRVPLTRVQTAQRRVTLTPSDTPADAVAAAQGRAAFEARDQVRSTSGRSAAIAAAEARALSGPCACVLAMVVRLDPAAALPVLAARAMVRAVQVAPNGARTATLAVSPLLPEQVTTVGPVPDDGVVPSG